MTGTVSDRTLAAEDLEAVRQFMLAVGEEVATDLTADFLSGGRSNVTYSLTDGQSKWVLRRPPFGGLTPSAHDVGREHSITAALVNTNVPVARPIGLCDDASLIGAPFTVAEFAEGMVVRTQDDLAAQVGDRTDACVGALIGTLSALHAVDVDAVGLGDFARRGGYSERQLRRWAGQWNVVARDRLLPDAERLRNRLEQALPNGEDSVIVHGDFRIDNVILNAADPTDVAAVVDWELCTLGDPVADVALMSVYRNPAFDLVIGFPAAWTDSSLPDAAQIAEQYEKASQRSLGNWEFHLGLAHYKLAVIAAGIDHRFRSGATHGDGFDSAGDAVALFMAEGLKALDH